MTDPESVRGWGLLAIFCDLEARWHVEFREWLREEMFPARLRIGFRCCASYDAVPDVPGLPKGSPPPFLTLYETSALADLYGPAYQGLRRERSPWDKAFHERMLGVERYTLASLGEGAEAGGAGFAPYVLVDRFDLRPDEIEAFNIWLLGEYAQWCAKVPGFVRMRRYLAMEGAPRHFILHEFEDEGFCSDKVWDALRRDMAWSHCVMTHGSPGLYRRVEGAP